MAKMVNVSDFDVNEMSTYSLQLFIQRYGKVANTRLRELESKGMSTGSVAYRYVERQAYGTIPIGGGQVPNMPGLNQHVIDQSLIFGYDTQGRPKFQTATSGRSHNQLKRQARQIQRFLGSRSSTPTGIRQMHEQAFETFRNAHGWAQDMTMGDYANLWNSWVVRHFVHVYGSDAFNDLQARAGEVGMPNADFVRMLEELEPFGVFYERWRNGENVHEYEAELRPYQDFVEKVEAYTYEEGFEGGIMPEE